MSLTDELGELAVEQIPSKLATKVVVAEHYLHRRPPISHAYGLYEDGELVGVVTYGTPASRHLQVGVLPDDPGRVIELNRLWVHDRMPRNTESWFVSRTLKLLPSKVVVSYADTKEGHLGYIYRALNFHYAGWTDMERKTARKDYIPIDPTKHTREAGRTGTSRTVPRKPKVKYWTVTGTKADKRYLTRECCWHELSWGELPPPTKHEQRKLPPKENA